MFNLQGETSSGKSSLLNLLLGANVLPYSLLCTTASVCRLHNIKPEEPRRFRISSKDSAPVSQIVREENYEGCIDQLQREITRRNTNSADQAGPVNDMEIDIYWPIPMLGECVNTVFTLTLGVGQCDFFSK